MSEVVHQIAGPAGQVHTTVYGDWLGTFEAANVWHLINTLDWGKNPDPEVVVSKSIRLVQLFCAEMKARGWTLPFPGHAQALQQASELEARAEELRRTASPFPAGFVGRTQ